MLEQFLFIAIMSLSKVVNFLNFLLGFAAYAGKDEHSSYYVSTNEAA